MKRPTSSNIVYLIWCFVVFAACSSRELPTTSRVQRNKATIYSDNSGADYSRECELNGVPVPKYVLGPGWVNHGVVDDVFESPTAALPGGGPAYPLEAELWSFTSLQPRGICLALPRWFTDGPEAGKAALFGVICMGQQSAKACFWDNPRANFFERGVARSMDDFVGGADLVANNQGICSDCHAGENPFVVHPEKAAFEKLRLNDVRRDLMMPNGGWYQPIIPNRWPSNPGPTSRLSGRTGASCTECHKLPEMSNQIPGYCGVRYQATRRPFESMPLRFGDTSFAYILRRNTYSSHVLATDEFCGEAPASGVIVYFGLAGGAALPDDPSVLSPPKVRQPLYNCTQTVLVEGVVPRSAVELFRNGASHATGTAGPDGVVAFSLTVALAAGEFLWATQEVGGTTSAPSETEYVVGYPNPNLPDPRITTPLYACADLVGVHTNENGVVANVTKNGDSTTATSRAVAGTFDAFGAPLPGPWQANDLFEVTTDLCGLQGKKVEARAVALPASLRPGTFWQPKPGLSSEVFEGQEYLIVQGLDNGAFARVFLRGLPTFIGETTSDSEGSYVAIYLPSSGLGRRAQLGDEFEAQASFRCAGSPLGPTVRSGTVLPCSALPAPEIARPVEGERFVSVTRAVPGARIRVYRGTTEIGDGTAPRVNLAPPNVFAAGETITVVQQVGSCTGTQGFAILTRAGL